MSDLFNKEQAGRLLALLPLAQVSAVLLALYTLIFLSILGTDNLMLDR